MTANLWSGLEIFERRGSVFAPTPEETEVVVPCMSKAFVDVAAGDPARGVSLGTSTGVRTPTEWEPNSRLR